MPDIRPLVPDEWPILRHIRLAALHESPDAFLATYEREICYDEDQWRSEFGRGDWNIGFVDGAPVSLLGVTQTLDTPADTRYLEYLWVAPGHRGRGTAVQMLTVILERLRVSGVRTAFLWVLDGNDVAMRVYKRVGFLRTDYRQPLPGRPGRSEERLYMNLA
jgi:ribosomal protein S18 acetylase RimI-like enzyme